MQARTICSLAVAAASVACAAAKPHTFGSYNDIGPRVAPVQGERSPQHLTVNLNRASNVAILFVVPGAPTRLLFPVDSMQGSRVEAGSHTVETVLARGGALSDTSRLARRPNNGNNPPNGRQGQNRGVRGGFDQNGNSLLSHGYLLMYATSDSLPFSVLSTKVAGISVPIDDDDALNTVTKLVRETTRSRGTWAAYATDFPP